MIHHLESASIHANAFLGVEASSASPQVAKPIKIGYYVNRHLLNERDVPWEEQGVGYLPHSGTGIEERRLLGVRTFSLAEQLHHGKPLSMKSDPPQLGSPVEDGGSASLSSRLAPNPHTFPRDIRAPTELSRQSKYISGTGQPRHVSLFEMDKTMGANYPMSSSFRSRKPSDDNVEEQHCLMTPQIITTPPTVSASTHRKQDSASRRPPPLDLDLPRRHRSGGSRQLAELSLAEMSQNSVEYLSPASCELSVVDWDASTPALSRDITPWSSTATSPTSDRTTLSPFGSPTRVQASPASTRSALMSPRSLSPSYSRDVDEDMLNRVFGLDIESGRPVSPSFGPRSPRASFDTSRPASPMMGSTSRSRGSELATRGFLSSLTPSPSSYHRSSVLSSAPVAMLSSFVQFIVFLALLACHCLLVTVPDLVRRIPRSPRVVIRSVRRRIRRKKSDLLLPTSMLEADEDLQTQFSPRLARFHPERSSIRGEETIRRPVKALSSPSGLAPWRETGECEIEKRRKKGSWMF